WVLQSVRSFVHPSPVNAVKLLLVFQNCFFERRNMCFLSVGEYLSVHSSFHHRWVFCEERARQTHDPIIFRDRLQLHLRLSVCLWQIFTSFHNQEGAHLVCI
ncbi:unnamed protein product, partial [Ectocarpus sp. 8 AP-2014]